MDIEYAIFLVKELDKYVPFTDYQTPEAIHMAVAALEEKLAEEKNEPIPFDELRKMSGMPVWIQPPDMPEFGRWGIVCGIGESGRDKMLFIENDFTCHEYGRVWLAYRHKIPKHKKEGE